MQELKKHILALQALSETLPLTSMREIHDDLALAIKGIVTVRRVK